MTADSDVYDALKTALAADLAPAAASAHARRAEGAYRRAEREAIAEDSAAPRQSEGPPRPFFRSVLGTSDPGPEGGEWTGSEFGKETLSFRWVVAREHDMKGDAAAIRAERAGERAQYAHRRSMTLARLAEDDAAACASWEGEGGRTDPPGIPDAAAAWALEAEHWSKVATEAILSERWQRQRADGERERCEKVDACGSFAIHFKCQPKRHGCGAEDVKLHTCQVGKLCITCRAREAAHARRRFGEGRMKAVNRAEKMGLFRKFRPGGRWSEKFLTVVVPHLTEAEFGGELRAAYGELHRDTAIRVQLLFDAWRFFSLDLQAWARTGHSRRWKRPGAWSVPRAHAADLTWHRSFEWTPGADGLGHPHFHVVMLSPFLPVELLRQWWTNALRRAGYQGETPPICPDVREIRTRRDEIARELHKGGGAKLRFADSRGAQDAHDYACGWTIAEYAQGEGRATTPTIARLYEALHARRLTQASRGFLPERPEGCSDCGALGAITMRRLVGEPSQLVCDHAAVVAERQAIREPVRGPPG